MGLTMKEKDSVTKEVVARYKNASKDEKKKILDEYINLTGFHRKYAKKLRLILALKEKLMSLIIKPLPLAK